MSQLQCNSIVPVGGIPAGASGGGIIQCVQTVLTSAFTLASAAGTFSNLTGLSVTITPRSTNSKVLIYYTVQGSSADNAGMHTKLQRGGVDILLGDAAGSDTRCTTGGFFASSGSNETHTNAIMYIDSPATTSATTYQVVISGGGSTVYVNRSVTTGNAYNPRCPSMILAMEISG